jgi:hypothetical protein
VADTTARGRAAGEVVRRAARDEGVVVAGAGPTLVVAGWSATEAVLADTDSVYLAPWLATERLLAAGSPHVAARDPLPARYITTLRRAYPGEPPSPAGHHAWHTASAATEYSVDSPPSQRPSELPSGHRPS